jgi:hypothetical protein
MDEASGRYALLRREETITTKAGLDEEAAPAIRAAARAQRATAVKRVRQESGTKCVALDRALAGSFAGLDRQLDAPGKHRELCCPGVVELDVLAVLCRMLGASSGLLAPLFWAFAHVRHQNGPRSVCVSAPGSWRIRVRRVAAAVRRSPQRPLVVVPRFVQPPIGRWLVVVLEVCAESRSTKGRTRFEVPRSSTATQRSDSERSRLATPVRGRRALVRGSTSLRSDFL